MERQFPVPGWQFPVETGFGELWFPPPIRSRD